MTVAVLLAALRAGWKAVAAACFSFSHRIGMYLVGALLLLVIGYRAGIVRGQAACQQSRADAAAMVAQKARGAMMVAADTETRRMSGLHTDNQNQEVVRYVTQQAAVQNEGGSICIAADLADRLRGLQ